MNKRRPYTYREMKDIIISNAHGSKVDDIPSQREYNWDDARHILANLSSLDVEEAGKRVMQHEKQNFGWYPKYREYWD